MRKTIMKYFMSLLLVIAMVSSITPVFAALPSEIAVVINGEFLEFDQPPIVVNERVMVPLRAIFEAFNCEVNYYADGAGNIDITAINSKVNMWISFRPERVSVFDDGWRFCYKHAAETYYWNDRVAGGRGEDKEWVLISGTTPVFLNGRTLVHVRVIETLIDAKGGYSYESGFPGVWWDGENREVIIRGDIPAPWKTPEEINLMNNVSWDAIVDSVSAELEEAGIEFLCLLDYDFDFGGYYWTASTRLKGTELYATLKIYYDGTYEMGLWQNT